MKQATRTLHRLHYSPEECVEGVFPEVRLQYPAQFPLIGLEDGRETRSDAS